MDAIESKAKNHIVMIGAACENGEAELNGTGFIVAWKGEAYVVTCRHVLDETEGDVFFAVPKLKHTLDPKPYGYPSILLGRSQYHPADNDEQTYDIGIFKVRNRKLADLQADDIVPLSLPAVFKSATYKENHLFTARGYPVVYMKYAFKQQTEEPLPPKEIHGRYRLVPAKEIPIRGDAVLAEGHFVEAEITWESGKGLSGGLVYTSDTGEVAGMAVAGGEYTIDEGESLFGFLFVSLKRIMEVIKNIG